MFDDRTSALIEESYAGAGAAMASTNVSLVLDFYARLFAAAPRVRGLFPEDIVAQAEKLEQTLDMAVAALPEPGHLVVPLRTLGAQHARLGVRQEHYALVADVLIATLAEAYCGRWTDDHEAAWRALLGFVSETMMDGATVRPAA